LANYAAGPFSIDNLSYVTYAYFVGIDDLRAVVAATRISLRQDQDTINLVS